MVRRPAGRRLVLDVLIVGQVQLTEIVALHQLLARGVIGEGAGGHDLGLGAKLCVGQLLSGHLGAVTANGVTRVLEKSLLLLLFARNGV